MSSKGRGTKRTDETVERMKHISDQHNRLIIAVHNAWCRLVYAKRIGILVALKHRHRFQRWTGAHNLLCWCGGVKVR